MSLLSPPPVHRGGPQSPDDVDNLLRAFFKAQMPNPWPSAEAPPPRRVAPTPLVRRSAGWPLMRSRLALAASVAMLVGGSLLLAGAFQGNTPMPTAPTVKNGSAGALKPDGSPLVPASPDIKGPMKIKINESLIQEPNGTTLKVDVIDWPTPPK